MRMLCRPSGDKGVAADQLGTPPLDADDVDSSVPEPPSPVYDDPLVAQLDALAARLDPAESLELVAGVSRPDDLDVHCREECGLSENFVHGPRSSAQLPEAPHCREHGEDLGFALDPTVFAASATEYLVHREGSNALQQQQRAEASLVPVGVACRVQSSAVNVVPLGGDTIPSNGQTMSQWRLKGLQQLLSEKGHIDSIAPSPCASLKINESFGEGPSTKVPPSHSLPMRNDIDRRNQVKLDGSQRRLKAEEHLANPYVKALRNHREEVKRSMDLEFVPTAESILATERTDSLATLRVEVAEYVHYEPAVGFLCSPEPCAPEPCYGSFYLLPEPCSGIETLNGVAALSTEELCEAYHDDRSYTQYDARKRGIQSTDDTAEASRSSTLLKDSTLVQSVRFDIMRGL